MATARNAARPALWLKPADPAPCLGASGRRGRAARAAPRDAARYHTRERRHRVAHRDAATPLRGCARGAGAGSGRATCESGAGAASNSPLSSSLILPLRYSPLLSLPGMASKAQGRSDASPESAPSPRGRSPEIAPARGCSPWRRTRHGRVRASTAPVEERCACPAFSPHYALARTQVKEHASLVLLAEARALLESGGQGDAAPTNGGGGAPPPPAAPMRLGAAPSTKPRYGLPPAGAGANGGAGGGAPSLPPLGVADGGRPPGLPALAPNPAPAPPPPLPAAASVPPPLSPPFVPPPAPPPASPPAQLPSAVTMGVLEPQLSPHRRTVDVV